MNDGFAYAAEALTGRFVGARDRASLQLCIRRCVVWALGTAAICIAIYVVWWEDILSMFVGDKSQLVDMLTVARQYIGWVIAIPLAAALPFLMDGIMVGATLTRVLRNSMLLSTVAYFAIYYSLHPLIGNNALWLAFTAYMALRGIAQYFMSGRLAMVYQKAILS
jgi:MATE family multidrug resistance protein